MKRENESKPIEIKSTGDFEKALQPYVDRRNEAEKRLKNLVDGLARYQGRLNEISHKLTEAIKDVQDDPRAKIDNALTLRQERDVLNDIVNDLRANGIPKAEADLKQANLELGTNLKILLEPLRQQFSARMSEGLSQAGAVSNEWAKYLDKTLASLKIAGLDPFLKEGLCKLVPFNDPNLSDYSRFISG